MTVSGCQFLTFGTLCYRIGFSVRYMAVICKLSVVIKLSRDRLSEFIADIRDISFYLLPPTRNYVM